MDYSQRVQRLVRVSGSGAARGFAISENRVAVRGILFQAEYRAFFPLHQEILRKEPNGLLAGGIYLKNGLEPLLAAVNSLITLPF